MPTMPFHLEKGDMLNALESLLNDHAHQADLETAVNNLLATNDLRATLDAAAAATGDASLANLVKTGTLAWFATPAYWKDYSGDINSIVAHALLFAMRRAWDWKEGSPFPEAHRRRRRIHLWWHCSQRWFESWVTWERKNGPIHVLFATPPIIGGTIWKDIDAAEQAGQANPLANPFQADPNGDMVLISQPLHEPTHRTLTLLSNVAAIPTPQFSTHWTDSGKVAAWSIPAHAGGMNKRRQWS